MFPHDSRDHSRKRKFIELGNTSTDPFGLNADAFHGRAPTSSTLYQTRNLKNMLDRPIKSFTSLLLDGICGHDDDYITDDEDEKEENLVVFRKKCKGQVVPLDPSLMESDHKRNLHTLKNETDGLWSSAIIQAAEKAEEKEAQIQKLLHDLYNKRKELVACQLENIVLEKKTKMAVKKIKSLRKTLKEVVSRPGGGHEEEGESSFVGTQRHEAAWLSCKVCGKRMANMIICPCNHLSVCRRCDDTITKCPICKAAKLSTVEICLP